MHHKDKIMDQHRSNITEGLEANDLKRLVHNELHIDEFKSKMGRDEDVVVSKPVEVAPPVPSGTPSPFKRDVGAPPLEPIPSKG